MRARLTSAGLPPQYRKDADRIFAEWEARYRDAVLERYLSAMMLTLSDLFGFGVRRMERVLAGFSEIVRGYNEDAYDGVEKKLQSMEDMNHLLREELIARGIEISQNHEHIVIRTAKPGRKEKGK